MALGLLMAGFVLSGAGCQTTVEEYTPPAPDGPAVPVDPHRSRLSPVDNTPVYAESQPERTFPAQLGLKRASETSQWASA